MPNLMVLGSDRRRADGLRGLLRQDGYDVTWLRDIRNWQDREREILPEVVVAAVDFSSEVLTGQTARPRTGFLAPILFVQQGDAQAENPFLDDRLVDRIATPFTHEELLARVDALARVRRVIQHVPLSPEDPAVVENPPGGVVEKMRRAGRQVAALLQTRVPRYDRPFEPYIEVANRVAQWADRRDAYQPGHAERVTSFCAMIAEGLDLATTETAALLRAAMLHDIGKVALPVEMLHQRSPLEEDQMRMIRTHPKRGAALIRELDCDDNVAETILCHHERPDGFGYYGLDDERIPIAARALAVSEVFDGMTTTSLTDPMTSSSAMERLEQFKGVSLDSDCVEALVDRLQPTPSKLTISPVAPHRSRPATGIGR
jgi:putative nucleotidyltransferase with HDIG domain